MQRRLPESRDVFPFVSLGKNLEPRWHVDLLTVRKRLEAHDLRKVSNADRPLGSGVKSRLIRETTSIMSPLLLYRKRARCGQESEVFQALNLHSWIVGHRTT